MRLIFVRHGHPDYEHDCLTPLGHLQAEATAERLADEPICTVYTSSCGRAVETARHIAAKHGLDIEPPFDFMREFHWGMPETTYGGSPYRMADAMIADNQSLLSPNWKQEMPFCEGSRLLNQFPAAEAGFDRFLSGLGFEREGNFYRVRRQNDDTVVMTSHGTISTVILSYLFNLPFPFLCQTLIPDYTAITVVQFSGEKGALITPTFEIANDNRHIKGLSTENEIGY